MDPSKPTYDASAYNSDEAVAAIMAMMGTLWIIILICWVLSIVVQWRILSKAGFSGALSLINLIPGLGQLIMAGIWIWVAFSEWPLEKRAKGTVQSG